MLPAGPFEWTRAGEFGTNRRMTGAASCGICTKLTNPDGVLFENTLWQLRAIDPPTPVPGWVLLVSRRHLAGPAELDEREADSFGPTLRHLHRVLLEVTGALRIYLAAMGESAPHLHAHFVPRYATMPKGAKAWGVFDLQRAATAGEIEVDEVEAARVAAKYRDALTLSPPPVPR
jgi:diadenosine tetraphosphate (Ap4A) HIT family hydrolase